MRTDTNELPVEGEGDYCPDHAREAAAAADTQDFPHVDSVCALMRRLRADAARVNPQVELPSDAFYGPPKLVIVDADFDIVREFPWDHSPHALEGAAETAKRLGGEVLVEQDIYFPAWPNFEDGWLDEGFCIEVWPRFRVRW